MKVELVKFWGNDLEVVNSARVSLGKHKEEIDESDIKLIKYLVDNSHVSVLEHSGFTFRIQAPIFVVRQIVRHKSHSFSEISGRYIEFEPEFYVPEVFREQSKSVKQGSKSEEESNLNQEECSEVYRQALRYSYQTYQMLLEMGVCKEQARAVLPLCLYTEFYQTMNLRSFYHFMKLRLDPHAQQETRDLCREMFNIISNLSDKPFQYSLKAFNLE